MTDAGLHHLAGLASSDDSERREDTDHGRRIAATGPVKSLKELVLDESQVTNAEIMALRRLLRECRFTYWAAVSPEWWYSYP